jgi:formate--tetrahydrofolate ligase
MLLREDEWQPRGTHRLALNSEVFSNRVAAEGGDAGPLIALCGADSDEASTVRLAAHLARELSQLVHQGERNFHAVARSNWPGEASFQVSVAHNAVSRAIDENLLGGNRARLDPRRLTWPRCIADSALPRQLRRVITGLESDVTFDAVPREETFVTPAQSELAALLTVSISEDDLATRLERLIIGWRPNGEPVFASAVLSPAELNRALPREVLRPIWLDEAFVAGDSHDMAATARLESGGAQDWPFGGVSALRAARFAGGAVAAIGGGMPGVRTWFDVFTPAAGQTPNAFVIRASVEAIREWGEAEVKRDPYHNSDAWMAGLNVLQGRITLLDRFGMSPIVAVEAARHEMAAAHGAVHVLDSYGLRSIAIEKQMPQDGAAPDIAALSAMVREWLMMETYPHAFISPGRAVRDQTIDIASTVFGAAPEWSAGAKEQLTRIEEAGGNEAAVIIEPEGLWDIWGGAHHLWGYSTPTALITHLEWRAAAGYVRALIRKI